MLIKCGPRSSPIWSHRGRALNHHLPQCTCLRRHDESLAWDSWRLHKLIHHGQRDSNQKTAIKLRANSFQFDAIILIYSLWLQFWNQIILKWPFRNYNIGINAFHLHDGWLYIDTTKSLASCPSSISDLESIALSLSSLIFLPWCNWAASICT